MGRSRKDSRRRITVDGVVYRYRVSPDDGFISLKVRSEAVRGQVLMVNFGYHDTSVPAGDGASSVHGHRLILPRVVRLAILEGLRSGWEPGTSRPGVYRLSGGDGLMPEAQWPRFEYTSRGRGGIVVDPIGVATDNTIGGAHDRSKP